MIMMKWSRSNDPGFLAGIFHNHQQFAVEESERSLDPPLAGLLKAVVAGQMREQGLAV
jgi:hypothetical protein